MESGNQPPDVQSDSTKAKSVIKQHALPVSVIVSSWFCGIIAHGVTCSFTQSPATMLLNHPSAKVRTAAWTWWLLAILLGVYVGLHVGKDVRSRYRKGKK